jgi:hypothetical protein
MRSRIEAMLQQMPANALFLLLHFSPAALHLKLQIGFLIPLFMMR